MSIWKHDLAVRAGQIVIEETGEVIAAFEMDLTAIEQWEERVAVLNAEAQAWRELRSAAIAKLSSDCCSGGIVQSDADSDGEWWVCQTCGKRHYLDYQTL